MKHLLKLYLSYLTVHLSNAQIKTCFRMLWFNYELKIETGNENTKQNAPLIHDFGWTFQNKIPCIFFSPKEKKTYVITLEVYNVKALEVYNIKTLEVFIY